MRNLLTMRAVLFSIIAGVLWCNACIAQDLERELSNLFFQLPVSSSVQELSSAMSRKDYLTIVPVKTENTITSYQVIKSATFNKHPTIADLGFRNEIVLTEANVESKKVKELSIIFNYRAEDKSVYEEHCKKLNKKMRSYFKRSEKKKNAYSFANESVNMLFRNKSDSLPTLKIISKQTFIEINNPKQAVYSIIVTYQQIIE